MILKALYKSKYGDIYLIGIILISIVALILGQWDITNQSLVAHDEGLYAGRAKLMFSSNDWFTPFESPHHKTVGSYWPILISYNIFGISEFSSRLPSSIFSILTLIITYFYSSEFVSKPASFLSSLLLMSMPLWYQYSRYASPDIIYVFLVILSSFIIYKTFNNRLNRRHLIRSSLFVVGFILSLAFFIRSFMVLIPISLFLPYIYFKLRLYYRSSLITWFFIGAFIGSTPLIISIINAYNHYGIESISLLFDFAKSHSVDGSLLKGFSYYPINTLLLSLPSVILFLPGIFLIKDLKDSNIKYLLLFTPLSILLILCISSSSYSHYSLVLYPYLAIISSFSIQSILSRARSSKIITMALSCFFFLLAVFIIYAINFPDKFISNLYISFKNLQIFIYIFSSFMILISIYSVFNNHNIYTKYILLLYFSAQTILFTFLYGIGIMGNPNIQLKYFANNIISNHNIDTVYFYNIEGKAKTLLQFYLPSYRHVKSLNELSKDVHILITDTSLRAINSSPNPIIFETLYEFKNLNLIKIIN